MTQTQELASCTARIKNTPCNLFSQLKENTEYSLEIRFGQSLKSEDLVENSEQQCELPRFLFNFAMLPVDVLPEYKKLQDKEDTVLTFPPKSLEMKMKNALKKHTYMDLTFDNLLLDLSKYDSL